MRMKVSKDCGVLARFVELFTLYIRIRYILNNLFFILNIIRIFANNIFQKMAKGKLTKEHEQLARFAKAFGHPVRVAILQMLAKQTCCYHGDMSEILPIAKSTLSQHLNELKEAGLIQGTITPPTVKYCINVQKWELAKSLFFAFLSQEIKNAENENCC